VRGRKYNGMHLSLCPETGTVHNAEYSLCNISAQRNKPDGKNIFGSLLCKSDHKRE